MGIGFGVAGSNIETWKTGCTARRLSGSWRVTEWVPGSAVKNGFSDPTKEQKGRDWPRKDVMNRGQAKALSEGCRERKKAQACVSSREKMNTNMNLARATTKSKSETQTVSNGCVGRGGREGDFEGRHNIGDLVE